MKNLIKNLLPKNLFLFLVHLRDQLKFYRVKYSSKNRLFVFISMIFTRSYIDEHEAMLKGAYWYEKQTREGLMNIYYLRRNIHRIEKGLLMRPLRKEFALRFILPTVRNYTNVQITSNPDITEWGEDILSEYFKKTESNDQRYINAQKIFLKRKKPTSTESHERKTPYVVQKNFEGISYSEFEKMLQTRKSTRWFSKKQVHNNTIEQALSLARMAPTSCNRQPYRYIVSTNPKKAVSLTSISGGTAGWRNNVPAIAILVGKQSSFTNTLNRHSIYIDSTLTVMPFILALETLGLSTCIINWVDEPNKVKKMKHEISINDDERIIMSIAIGYSDEHGKVACSQRMPVKNIAKFI